MTSNTYSIMDHRGTTWRYVM